MMQTAHAMLLGLVEGMTEFLPVSSTGHLILTAHLLHLHSDALKTYEVVIQAGALGAVVWLYRARFARICRGLAGRDAQGWALGRNLLLSFVPAAVAGAAWHQPIKAVLFTPAMVAWALAAGGIAMLALDPISRRPGGRPLETLTSREALLIGLAQCLALWPGMSRAMVTMAAGMLVGLAPTAAVEYSFLLAVPTLGAATLFDAALGGHALVQEAGLAPVAAGFVVALLVAAGAIRGLLRYLSHHGLAVFGWYRIGLAGCIWWLGPQLLR